MRTKIALVIQLFIHGDFNCAAVETGESCKMSRCSKPQSTITLSATESFHNQLRNPGLNHRRISVRAEALEARVLFFQQPAAVVLANEAHAVDRWQMRRDAVPGVTLIFREPGGPCGRAERQPIAGLVDV